MPPSTITRSGFNATGTAGAEELEVRFDDSSEALQWLTEFFWSLAGVEVADDVAWIEEDEILLKGVNGRVVTVERTGDIDQWILTFDLDGNEVEIECSYDPGARVWAGKDSFDMFPPYYLSGGGNEEVGGPGPYRAIAAIWRHLVEPT